MLVTLDWVGLGPNFQYAMGWVGLINSVDGLSWVWSGHGKLTHGQLCVTGKKQFFTEPHGHVKLRFNYVAIVVLEVTLT